MNTMKTTLKLEMAYTVNSFQYFLRHTPLIKRLFKNSSYEIQDVKLAISILSVLFKILIKMFFSVLFFMVPVFAAQLRLENSPASDRFSLIILLTLVLFVCGGIGNNAMMGTDANDYYSVCLLRMDAREYFLSSYLLERIWAFLSTWLLNLIICLIYKAPLWMAFVMPVSQVCIKLDFQAVRFLLYRRFKVVAPDPLGKKAWLPFTIIFLGGIALLVFAVVLPLKVLLLIALVPVLPAISALLYVLKFDDFLFYFKQLYTEKVAQTAAVKTNAIVINSKLIDTKAVSVRTDKTGFAFMNECFEKRHHKLISDPIRLITIISAAIALLVNVLAFMKPDFSTEITGSLIKIVPFLPFVFYTINRGQNYTLVLFSNCDRTLLNYSFFRKPHNILSLFKIRLLSIARQNLIPAGIISIGLVALQIISAGSVYGFDNIWSHVSILNLVLLLIAPLSISVFFSAHYLILYYLIQPFDSEAKAKAPLYSILTAGTYFPCYFMAVNNSVRNLVSRQPVTFAVILVAFCLFYSALGCFLVYKFGPKHFKPKR